MSEGSSAVGLLGKVKAHVLPDEYRQFLKLLKGFSERKAMDPEGAKKYLFDSINSLFLPYPVLLKEFEDFLPFIKLFEKPKPAPASEASVVSAAPAASVYNAPQQQQQPVSNGGFYAGVPPPTIVPPGYALVPVSAAISAGLASVASIPTGFGGFLPPGGAPLGVVSAPQQIPPSVPNQFGNVLSAPGVMYPKLAEPEIRPDPAGPVYSSNITMSGDYNQHIGYQEGGNYGGRGGHGYDGYGNQTGDYNYAGNAGQFIGDGEAIPRNGDPAAGGYYDEHQGLRVNFGEQSTHGRAGFPAQEEEAWSKDGYRGTGGDRPAVRKRSRFSSREKSDPWSDAFWAPDGNANDFDVYDYGATSNNARKVPPEEVDLTEEDGYFECWPPKQQKHPPGPIVDDNPMMFGILSNAPPSYDDNYYRTGPPDSRMPFSQDHGYDGVRAERRRKKPSRFDDDFGRHESGFFGGNEPGVMNPFPGGEFFDSAPPPGDDPNAVVLEGLPVRYSHPSNIRREPIIKGGPFDVGMHGEEERVSWLADPNRPFYGFELPDRPKPLLEEFGQSRSMHFQDSMGPPGGMDDGYGRFDNNDGFEADGFFEPPSRKSRARSGRSSFPKPWEKEGGTAKFGSKRDRSWDKRDSKKASKKKGKESSEFISWAPPTSFETAPENDGDKSKKENANDDKKVEVKQEDKNAEVKQEDNSNKEPAVKSEKPDDEPDAEPVSEEPIEFIAWGAPLSTEEMKLAPTTVKKNPAPKKEPKKKAPESESESDSVVVNGEGETAAKKKANKKQITMPLGPFCEHKHPVSSLHQICQVQCWGSPVFWFDMEEVEDNKFMFLGKVTVEDVTYYGTQPYGTKKDAKTDAAMVAYEALGVPTKGCSACEKKGAA